MSRRTEGERVRGHLLWVASLVVVAAACTGGEAAPTDDLADSGEQGAATLPADDPEPAVETTSPGAGASAALVVDVATYAFEGTCTDLANLGRATFFGTGTTEDAIDLELSVSYTYPTEGFDPSGGFTILTADGDLFLESGGLTEASFDGSEMVIDSGLRSGVADDAGRGSLVVSCS